MKFCNWLYQNYLWNTFLELFEEHFLELFLEQFLEHFFGTLFFPDSEGF